MKRTSRVNDPHLMRGLDPRIHVLQPARRVRVGVDGPLGACDGVRPGHEESGQNRFGWTRDLPDVRPLAIEFTSAAITVGW